MAKGYALRGGVRKREAKPVYWGGSEPRTINSIWMRPLSHARKHSPMRSSPLRGRCVPHPTKIPGYQLYRLSTIGRPTQSARTRRPQSYRYRCLRLSPEYSPKQPQLGIFHCHVVLVRELELFRLLCHLGGVGYRLVELLGLGRFRLSDPRKYYVALRCHKGV